MNHLHSFLASAFLPIFPTKPAPHLPLIHTPSSSSGAPPLGPPTIDILGVNRRIRRQQQLHQLAMAILRSQVQRCAASGALRNASHRSAGGCRGLGRETNSCLGQTGGWMSGWRKGGWLGRCEEWCKTQRGVIGTALLVSWLILIAKRLDMVENM